MQQTRLYLIFFMFFCSIALLLPVDGSCGDVKDMGGWEIDGEYNRHFDLDEFDSFRGNIVKIKKIVPMPGMSPGVGLLIQESGDELITVHVCPLWYANPKKIGVKNGDRVKVKGAWAEINEEDVFMLSKLKKGDTFEFKVRLTKDGTPFWTMSPEELEKELGTR